MKIGPANGGYELTIPDSWKFEASEDSFDIYKDPDQGAMSISDYVIPPDFIFVKEDQILDFLKSANDPPTVRREDIQYLSDTWCSAEMMENGKYFKVWLYYKYRYAVFITWVCDIADRDADLPEVEQIVSSLKVGSLDRFQ